MHENSILIICCLGICVLLTACKSVYRFKMAKLKMMASTKQFESESAKRLEDEVSELRQTVHEQAILIDDLSSMHRRLLKNTPEDNTLRSSI